MRGGIKMLSYGCCLPIASFVPQVASTHQSERDTLAGLRQGLHTLHVLSWDFAELTAGTVNNLSEEAFKEFKRILKDTPLKVLAYNSFIPASIALTGPNVNRSQITSYLEKSIGRIGEAEGKIIVFGSGGARRVPEGWTQEAAKEQLLEFLTLCNQLSKAYGITIAIEPLNKRETNIIHTVQEALELSRSLNLPQVKVLADTYHMHIEKESFDILKQAKEELAHVHVADGNRMFPRAVEQGVVDFQKLLNILREIGYEGGVSAECNFKELEWESSDALKFMKSL